MQKHEAINFMDYEKISDDLCYLGKGIILRFNVQLARKNSGNKTREYCIKEFKYGTSKYINKNNLITVRRSFDYYISFDVTNDFENSIMIRPKDMFNLQNKINMVYKWFNTIFKVKNNKLIISGNWNKIKVGNLSENKYIAFEPVIIEFNDNTCTSGVRLYINSDTVFTDIDIDKFMGLVYLLSKIDMYQCALSIMSSIPYEYGQNIYNMESMYQNPNLNDESEGETIVKRSSNKRKSFFDD